MYSSGVVAAVAISLMVSPFTRKPPSFLEQCLFGALMGAVVVPVVWTADRLGLLPAAARWQSRRAARRLAKKPPFGGYTPTEHDVFVATYVKSGTNWMMQIAHQLVFHGQGEFEHIHSVVPWPDVTARGRMRHYAIPLADESVWGASPEHKRVIKTHFDWSVLPYSPQARYISVIRDPKDVFVSGYHFFIRSGPQRAAISKDAWFRLFLSGDFPLWGSWAATTASYWSQRHRPNVLVLSFESMKLDLEGTVRRVAALLDVHVSDEIVNRVCERSSFDYMKRIDHKFRVWRVVPWGSEWTMIRKGALGGSSELLSRDEQRRVDDCCRAALERLGSDFPYDEWYGSGAGAPVAASS